jgi:hypothetical protein
MQLTDGCKLSSLGFCTVANYMQLTNCCKRSLTGFCRLVTVSIELINGCTLPANCFFVRLLKEQ